MLATIENVNVLDEVSVKNNTSNIFISEKDYLNTEKQENQIDFIYSALNDTNYLISENEITEKRMFYLRTKITPLFISLLKYEEFEFGQKSESIRIVENELKTNKLATTNWLNELYITYYSIDEKILIGILRIIEYFEEKTFYPASQTIAIASLINKNDEVKELAIRIFENWASIDSYKILKSINVDAKWLKSYIKQVLIDLEKELCLS